MWRTKVKQRLPCRPGVLCSSVSDLSTVALNDICAVLNCGAALPLTWQIQPPVLPIGNLCSFTSWKLSSSKYRWILRKNLIFIRISISKETYTSVLCYKECYLCASPFISPAHFFMIKGVGKGWRGLLKGYRKAEKALNAMNYILIWDVYCGFGIWLYICREDADALMVPAQTAGPWPFLLLDLPEERK